MTSHGTWTGEDVAWPGIVLVKWRHSEILLRAARICLPRLHRFIRMRNLFRSQSESVLSGLGDESATLLVANTEDSNEELHEKADYNTHSTSRPATSPSGSRWLSFLIIALVLVDIAAYISIARLLVGGDNKPVPIRNTYVGLQDLYAAGKVNTSTYPPIENRPRVEAQISVSEPSKIFPVDRLRWLSTLGRMSPPDLRLRVTNDIHTIVQFRVIDYGMERCQLAIRLPKRNVDLPEPFIFPVGIHALHLNVCELDTPKEIDIFTLSYNNRPRCVNPLGTLVVSPDGEAKLPEFVCKWSEHHAYEISCADESPACMLDVRATQYDTWGAFMYQYQTV